MMKTSLLFLLFIIVSFQQADAPSKNDLMGKINPATHVDFVQMDGRYLADNRVRYMRKAAYESFVAMCAAAQKDGITFKVISATRNFDDQKTIWENKWRDRTPKFSDSVALALNILEYSSMPATSRHHWGTDIDLNALTNAYFDTGQGKKEYDWLQKNAKKFGFHQPYTAKDKKRPKGYNEERWHWSYLPLSSKFLEAYQKQVQVSDIQGFLGANVAKSLDVINTYVLGINPKMK